MIKRKTKVGLLLCDYCGRMPCVCELATDPPRRTPRLPMLRPAIDADELPRVLRMLEGQRR